jgi:hypothetical protein
LLRSGCVLLTVRNRTLKALAEARIHPHESIARPFTNLLVAGLLRHVF